MLIIGGGDCTTKILSSSHCDNIKIYIDDKLVNQAPSILSQNLLFIFFFSSHRRRCRFSQQEMSENLLRTYSTATRVSKGEDEKFSMVIGKDWKEIERSHKSE